MGLTFEQLLTVPTPDDVRALLFGALQGVGFVRKAGYGAGSVTASGTVILPASVRLKIATTGSLGTATFQLSTDGGATYGAAQAVPGGGSFAIPSTGVTVQFANGPAGSGDAFLAGDVYALELTTPTLAATSWHVGSVPRTLIETDAALMAEYAATQRAIAAGGYLSTATGDWLDILLREVYGTERIQGLPTQGTIRLADLASAGPFTIVPGQLWVGTTLGLRYSNVTGGILPQGGTLDLLWQAEKPGTAYNVSNSSVNVMFTTLPGVVVTNPGPGGGATWISQQGRNRETDAEAVARAKLRWPTLSTGATADQYTFWAKQTPTYGQNVTRTKVKASATVPGQVDVYLAGPAGAVGGSTVTTVNDYIQPRINLTNLASVQSATNAPIVMAGTVYHFPGFGTVAQAQVAQNLAAYVYGGTDSAGVVQPGVPINGHVYRTALIEMVMQASGVRNVDLATPAAEDTTLGETEVATLNTSALVFVEVTS